MQETAYFKCQVAIAINKVNSPRSRNVDNRVSEFQRDKDLTRKQREKLQIERKIKEEDGFFGFTNNEQGRQ